MPPRAARRRMAKKMAQYTHEERVRKARIRNPKHGKNCTPRKKK